MLDRIVAAEARADYRIWIRFEDGLEGELSVEHLLGRGVFSAWSDPAVFRALYVDEDSGTVAWPGDIDLAPDALRTRLVEITAAAG